ncbi:MAG: electron transfer flavoprotein [Candidatus Aenigmatarchaeota archaeon]|nr:MAG: electron transfer flavoprotein [Candidatus Aenigmarchaeota archaeon]
MYDFVVVGAGPVGAYLSWKLSKKGYKTLLIEEHSTPGKPLACSGLISKEVFRFVPKGDFVENEIRAAHIHVDTHTFEFRKKEVHAYVIDRTRLDSYLVERSVESGTELFLNHRFEDFMELDDSLRVYVKTPKSFINIKTKILCGCDGPLSSVRRSANLPPPRSLLHGIFCYTNEKDGSDCVDLFFRRYLRGFFGWRIPRGGCVEYGLALPFGAPIQKIFKLFLKEQGVRRITSIHSGLIPTEPPKRTISGRVLLLGDAAAQVKPHTGGGVVYGLTSAYIASQVLDPENPETTKTYETLWRKHLGKEILIGSLIKNSYSLSPFLQRISLSFLEKISQHKDIHMDRPTSLLK